MALAPVALQPHNDLAVPKRLCEFAELQETRRAVAEQHARLVRDQLPAVPRRPLVAQRKRLRVLLRRLRKMLRPEQVVPIRLQALDLLHQLGIRARNPIPIMLHLSSQEIRQRVVRHALAAHLLRMLLAM
ncbi:hypothetical protein AYI69_g2237 [Smittium culicis]|uniref:Uncharacterized protein n=1 Tax=Smittium culicis TaxID=133412 RepID=A0A1R1YN01_9FUNG|nr:hypothetical protein AYI69_g2237 [Smittium culicis]